MTDSEVYVSLSPAEWLALARGEAVVLTDRGPARSTIRITLANPALALLEAALAGAGEEVGRGDL